MKTKLIEAYLEQAREIVEDRTPGEIEYDNSVVSHLRAGMDIKRAIGAANNEFPEEALDAQRAQWGDVADHYDYILKHKMILKELGIEE